MLPSMYELSKGHKAFLVQMQQIRGEQKSFIK